MFRSNRNLILFIVLFTFIPINAQTNVACIGNSITWGDKLPDRATESYPSRLGVLLGDGYVVKNYGAGGRTVLHNTEQPYYQSEQHGFSIATPHDIVIILLGTNDSAIENWVEKDHFKEDYYDLIDDYNMNYPTYGDPIVILGLPPPVFDESQGHRNAPIIDEIIPMIKQIADELDLTIADFYNAFVGKPEFFIDGVHPNGVGTEIMAEIAYDAIFEALSVSNPPPDTPTGLKTIPGLTSIGLEWHANTEDTIFSYNIYRSFEEGAVQDYIGITFHPDTTFSDNNVILNHIYYYSIDAKNTHNNVSSRTAPVAGKTLDFTPPAPPVDLQVKLEADSVKLTWTANTELDIDKYYVYRNTILDDIQQPSSIIGTVHSPKSYFNDQLFDSATNYYYAIKAVDISGNQGETSNIVNITTKSRPISADTTLTFFEDVPHSFNMSDFPFFDIDNDSLDKIIFINSNQCAYFTCNNDSIDSPFTFRDTSKLIFTPDLDEFGDNYTDFTFRVVDSFGSTSIDTDKVIIDVLPVNDAPHIDLISDVYLFEDSHNIIVPISGIDSGPNNEIQNLSVHVLPSDTSLIKISEIHYTSPNDTGYVIIDPVENVFGTRPVTIKIIDDGGTENGGVDFVAETFTLYITPRNDPPSLNVMDKISIEEDSELLIELGGINAGPQEYNEIISMSIISNNTNILPNPILDYTSPDTSAFVTFTTIPNVSGNSSITIFMSDDGGTEFGGDDSASYVIPVEIKPINDAPSNFSMITPTNDSTFVINKSNYLESFLISWEESNDIENNDILYDLIFNGDLSTLSRYGLTSLNSEYSFKELLAATDTVSIANSTFSIIASDGDLQTTAINSGIRIQVDGRAFAPAKLNLDQNHPNPFNYGTLIGFDLPKRTEVSLTVYNLLGKEVIRLIDNKIYDRGYNTITWNGLDKYQNHIPSGAYILQIKTDSEVEHKKLLLLK